MEFAIGFYVVMAIVVAVAANSRGRAAGWWFLGALLVSPLIALILVLVMPNLRTEREVATDPLEERGPCPRCGESIPLAAVVCRFCGLDLEKYDDELLAMPEDQDAADKS